MRAAGRNTQTRGAWRATSACGLLALLVSSTAALIALGRAEAAIPVHSIGRADGLPSSQVHATVRDQEGLMWFAGPSGLSRYDGSSLEVLGRREGLSIQGLRSLANAADGALLIGTDVGVDRRLDGRLQALVAPEDWPYGFVEDIYQGDDGVMWVATATGLVSWTENRGAFFADPPELRETLMTAVRADSSGRLWAAGPVAGVWSLVDGQWRAVPDAAWQAVAPVRALATGLDGAMIVGGARGAAEIGPDGARVRAFSGDKADAPVTAALAVEDELWLGIGSSLRVYRTTGTSWELGEVVSEGVAVNHLHLDEEGNIWASTNGNGVLKVSTLRAALQPANQPCAGLVFSIRETASGDRLIAGGQCSWLASGVDAQPLQRFPALDGIAVWDFLEDTSGAYYAATQEGLFVGRRGEPLVKALADSAVAMTPNRVLDVDGDTLIVGTVTGLFAVDGEQVVERVSDSGESLGYVYTLTRDTAGSLWIGTIGNGLWRQMGGRLYRVESEALSSRSNVYAIAFEPDGSAIVGVDKRLLRVEDDRASELSFPVENAVVLAANIDRSGELWLGSNRGLIEYDRKAQAPQRRVDGALGLSGYEFTTSRSLSLDRTGRLWCGLDGGLTLVDIARLRQFQKPPAALLRSASWNGADKLSTGNQLKIHDANWSFEVQPYSPQYIAEKSVRFRHRLLGFEDRWSDPAPGENYRIRYNNVPTGTYRLQVQAYMPLSGWGESTELLAFQVPPPWWQSAWARVLWLALALMVLAIVWHRRARRLTEKARNLEQELLQQEELNKLRERLRQTRKLETVGEMAGGIAHDFNNMLTPVIGGVGLVQSTQEPGSENYIQLENALTAARRAADLVNQILIFSRQKELLRGPVEIAPIVAESLKLLRASIPANIELVDRIEVGKAIVIADSTQLQQVVLNLCANAQQAMEEGGRIEVELTLVPGESELLKGLPSLKGKECCRLRIRDNGPGIPPEIMGRLFDPFFTTKEVGKGTGLGLATVYGIVTALGGEIVVDSVRGKGALFDVYLPRSTDTPAVPGPTAPATAMPAPTAPATAARKLRILFVDDEPAIVKLVETILNRDGYDLVVASSSRQALERIQEDPWAFDLVIADLTMRELTGDRLATEIRTVRHDLPIIIISGDRTRISDHDLSRLAPIEFLSKPFLPRELLEAIARAS